MLNAVAQLPQNSVRNVNRRLRHKVHTNALGADEAHDLIHFLSERLGAVVKKKMRFVKEEHKFGLFQVSGFRQRAVDRIEKPQQER